MVGFVEAGCGEFVVVVVDDVGDVMVGVGSNVVVFCFIG